MVSVIHAGNSSKRHRTVCIRFNDSDLVNVKRAAIHGLSAIRSISRTAAKQVGKACDEQKFKCARESLLNASSNY